MFIGGAVIYTLGVVLWSVGALFLRATGFPMMDIQAILLDTDVVLEYFLDELPNTMASKETSASRPRQPQSAASWAT